MASINKLVPGQTLYDVKRNTGLASFQGKYSVWPVLVVEVNKEEGWIIARWNELNQPRKMHLRSVSKLRVKPPKE